MHVIYLFLHIQQPYPESIFFLTDMDTETLRNGIHWAPNVCQAWLQVFHMFFHLMLQTFQW